MIPATIEKLIVTALLMTKINLDPYLKECVIVLVRDFLVCLGTDQSGIVLYKNDISASRI